MHVCTKFVSQKSFYTLYVFDQRANINGWRRQHVAESHLQPETNVSFSLQRLSSERNMNASSHSQTRIEDDRNEQEEHAPNRVHIKISILYQNNDNVYKLIFQNAKSSKYNLYKRLKLNIIHTKRRIKLTSYLH